MSLHARKESVEHIEGLSIIVVEDDEQVRKALTLALEQTGNSVLGVSDASSAVNAAQITSLPAPPDIIIADYRLENGLIGADVIHDIRELLDAKIPAFLLTGDTAPERIREAMQSGFPVVHKPVDLDVILGKISEALFIEGEG